LLGGFGTYREKLNSVFRINLDTGAQVTNIIISKRKNPKVQNNIISY